MGVAAYAAIATAAAGAYSTYSGSQQNKKAEAFNAEQAALSRQDYADRLALAAKGSKELEKQFNEARSARPDLSWKSFVKGMAKSLQDPLLEQAFMNSKDQDFKMLRQLAKTASADNLTEFGSLFDKLNLGEAEKMIRRRNDLVLEDTSKDRFEEAQRLSAPSTIASGSVAYDKDGNLIAGQRAHKSVFSIAKEESLRAKESQKRDLRELELDRRTAALSQQEKAKDFTSFYDKTGLAISSFSEQRGQLLDWQQKDEDRAFRLYEMFAAAASGITPTAPNYGPTNPGNSLIASGSKQVASGLADYYKAVQTNNEKKAAEAKK